MNMTQSTSSNISSFGYDAAHRTLRIKFKSGDEWDYKDVPASKFEALQAADSHGKYFHAHIRGSHDAVRGNRAPEATESEMLAQLRDVQG
jgi:hypothetical protein